MKKLLFRCLLLLLVNSGQAWSQPTNYLIDQTREGAWRYTNQPETLSQLNGRVIQHQLTALGKLLNHLSVVDVSAYCELQAQLHQQLYKWEMEQVNYGSPAVYQAALLYLTQLSELVKRKLSFARRSLYENSSPTVTADSLLAGRTATVRPYALLFRRPDYRSKLVYVVWPTQLLTILQSGPGDYCYVQYGTHRGYLNKGMLIQLLP